MTVAEPTTELTWQFCLKLFFVCFFVSGVISFLAVSAVYYCLYGWIWW